MKSEYYYIYCKGILGVKTNINNFSWVYGSVAPTASFQEYEKCVVKFDICIKKEKKLNKSKSQDQRFQSYTWNKDSKTISFRRKLLGYFEIGYNLKISGNTAFVEIGERYYRFVKNRIMNLHGIYYLLSDLANVMLLNNGFLTLYASSVYFEPLKRCVVNFAPPNTGKTYTATKLCERSGYRFVGEDLVIFDGCKIYSCPWTSSYRKDNQRMLDSSSSLGRIKKTINTTIEEECEVSDVTVLSLGKKRVAICDEQVLQKVSFLNGYLFNYYSSPVVKILGYFDKEYNKQWNIYAERLLKKMVSICRCYELQSEKSIDFPELLHETIFGEKV